MTKEEYIIKGFPWKSMDWVAERGRNMGCKDRALKNLHV